ncbi:MAG TPA: phospho-N-acetylmuramoyl-pentapeptide-transferase [Candidatus Merdivicinus intestinavium]|nr:phospho-N-acetylmuramoyl-pentapeptide-transferase [Candidatus Merdivicinus intestinavium]
MESISCFAAALAAFAVSAVSGKFLIPFLRKIKFGQTIKDIGPVWHKNKQGTPNMGGFMFIIGSAAGILIGYLIYRAGGGAPLGSVGGVKLFGGLGLALGCGFIGFLDDYIKDVKKQNLGLRAKQKLALQLVVAVAYLAAVYLAGDTSTVVIFPFIGQLDLGIFYYILAVLFILFISNAVNLTDGIDGLAGSVTFVVCLAALVMAGLLQQNGMGLYSAALAGGILGFLIYNFYPAKVFMGDTGSMFLGGSVLALGFGLNLPVLIAVFGIIYVIEALSVILQVISFQTTGKRIFKMSPIHHHFEMCGWSEKKIVGVFSLVTLVGCVISVVAVFNI